MNTKHVLITTAYWTSIVYAVCFAGVALFPGLREGFMLYALHSTVSTGADALTATTFLAGLVIWNVIAFLAVGLFAFLYNRVKA